MKKIFTMIAAGLLAGTVAAHAEAVTLQVCTSKGVEVAKSSQTELTRDDKGNYVIASFLNSGSPVAFTFDSTVEKNTKTPIELKGNIYDENPYLYLLDSYGNDMICKINALEGDDVFTMYYPYVYYGKTYSYVMPLNKAEDDYDYLARFLVSGYDNNNAEADWYYIFMYFDEIPFEGGNEEDPDDEIPATVTDTFDVTVYNDAYYYPDYDDYDTYTEKEFKPFNTQLEAKSDGSYTLKNIFGTDNSISYTIGKYNPKNIALLTFTDNIKATAGYESYPYFLTPDGKYVTVTVEDEDGEKLEVDYLSGNEGSDYSYIQKSSDAEIAEGYDEYYVYLCVSGFVGDAASVDMYLSFGYNLKTNAVGEVEINHNAPVEYYNLNGQRVTDPSNGLFIRKQGSKTSKVVIR